MKSTDSMTNDFSNRRGSALLIVLGMLSFMIVSAVAFSVYMRMSRAPSSFLRRNVATSDLVKAALARAIEDIDDKIGNDVYPGIGVNATEQRDYTAYDQWRYSGYEDAWINRVFCPYSNNQGDTPVNKTGNRNSNDSSNLGYDDTAAVLTLEGLGYIPAPLVNQARYWSRRSMTARWKRFNYDLGRWAYTAINVSDLLDVNAIAAYTNRNSGTGGRLSLYSLVEKAGCSNPQNFDRFVRQTRGGELSQVPFTSVLDMNLALQSSGPVPSPFYDWITKGGNNGFYGNSQSNQVAPLVFMTDSWYPTTNQFVKGYKPDNDQNFYLSRPLDQPFLKFNNTKGMLEFFKNGNPVGSGDSLVDAFAPQIRAAGVACLYDYLDKDSIPISLALPCTEQVPMIIGLCPIAPSLKFTIKRTDTEKPLSDEPPKRKITESQYTIKLEPLTINVNASLLFPFKRLSGTRKPQSFKVQALVRLYWGADNMPMRVTANDSPLHPQPQMRGGGTWSGGSTKFENSMYTIVSSEQNVTVPDASNMSNGDEAEAIIDMPLMTFTANDGTEYPFFHRIVETRGDEVVRDEIDAFSIQPYAADGTAAAWSGQAFNKAFNNNTIIPNIAVWLRVIDSSGNTVDLVPATLQDDNLNWSLGLSASQAATVAGTICGTGTPLFNFKTKDIGVPSEAAALKVFAKAIIAGTDKQITGSMADDYGTLYCYDPRYNFAPEDWYATTDKGVDADKWLENIQNNLLGQNGRDSDIFMFVSNQEYLQSMGELAFLPRTQDLVWNDAGGGIMDGTYFNAGRYNGTSITFADRIGYNLGNAANNAFFWRTYRSYAQGDLAADPIYNFRDSGGYGIFDDEGNGARVNPYTEDSENIFLAAIANTPEDYWAASTNKTLGAQSNNFASNPAEALKHCFNEESTLSKVPDKEIRGIAAVIQSKIRSGGADWLSAYNDLDWYGNGDPHCFLNNVGDTDANKNVTQTAINEVDRKFLYSFWRNCFGNRQQLFIVFVRAEPSVLGGAQQGGRAVALVWRDPIAPAGFADRRSRQLEKNNGTNNNMLPPHRTRVLFYHQFD